MFLELFFLLFITSLTACIVQVPLFVWSYRSLIEDVNISYILVAFFLIVSQYLGLLLIYFLQNSFIFIQDMSVQEMGFRIAYSLVFIMLSILLFTIIFNKFIAKKRIFNKLLSNIGILSVIIGFIPFIMFIILNKFF